MRVQRKKMEIEEQEAKALRNAEEARIKAERDSMEKQRAELEERRREEEMKRRKAKTLEAIQSIDDVKSALAAMQILPDEAIDKSYEIGYKAGYEAE